MFFACRNGSKKKSSWPVHVREGPRLRLQVRDQESLEALLSSDMEKRVRRTMHEAGQVTEFLVSPEHLLRLMIQLLKQEGKKQGIRDPGQDAVRIHSRTGSRTVCAERQAERYAMRETGDFFAGYS